jgi:hypothetical protein
LSDLGQLKVVFGAPAGSVIHTWAEQEGLSIEVKEVLTNGTTSARVVVVAITPEIGYRTKCLIKVCPPDDEGRPREARRHNIAVRQFPDFSRDHLVKLAYPSLPVENDELVMFQELAGNSVHDTPPLARILDNVARHGPIEAGSALDLALISKTVFRSVLQDWGKNQANAGRTEKIAAPAFLRSLLGPRIEPGGSLQTWAGAHAGALLDPTKHWISIDKEVLVNPIRLASDESLCAERFLEPFLGPVHGDLHEENVLVTTDLGRLQARPNPPKVSYRLIDLSKFDASAPLAFDPVHMLLSMVGRHLDGLPADQQVALARYVIDPRDAVSAEQLPGWRQKLVSAFHSAPPPWLDKFESEWREQTLLSMVAGGLIYACRRTTPPANRWWYARLAAMAADKYVGVDNDLVPGPTEVGSLEIRHDPAEPVPRVQGVGPKSSARHGRPAAVERAGRDVLPGPIHSGSDHEDEAQPPKVGANDVRRVARELLPVADKLADRVLRQLEDMAQGRRLVSPGPIRIGWAKASAPIVGPISDAVGDPGHRPWLAGQRTDLSDETLRTRGEVPDLLGLYCGVRSRMVIVGSPGAGKTAAAIQLAIDVLRYRQDLPDDERAAVAVPVLLTPCDWDPRTSLKAWITRALIADHPQLSDGRSDAGALAQLVDGGHVALVLDGLDDMPERARAEALGAIDRQALLRVIVLGRTAEMVTAAATEHLTSAAAVELQPVSADEAAAYLCRCQLDPLPEAWTALVERLRAVPEGPVAQALDSPLMLGLVRDNYRDNGDVREILDVDRFPTRKEVEQHLLLGAVPSAYRRAGDEPSIHSAEEAQRWLGFLAHHMRGHNTRDLAWWRLPRAVHWLQRFVVQAFVTGLLPCVSLGVLGAFGGRPFRGLMLGFGFGPAAVLFDTLVIHGKERMAREAARRIALGYVLICAVTGAIGGSLLVGVARGALRGSGVGLAVGLGAGVLSVRKAVKELGADSRPTAGASDVLRPTVYWHQDGRRALWFGGILAFLLAVTLAGVCSAVGEPLTRIGPAVALEAMLMLVFARTLSPRAQTQMAVLQLWLRRKAPRRLVPFLEEARKLDVLRSAGPVYQFRHARVQDVLADLYEAQRGSRRSRRNWFRRRPGR